MPLSELQLSCFRSYKAAKISTSGRSVVLTGPNGAGKTTILEAISLFSPGRGIRSAQAAEMARRQESVGWKVTGTFSLAARDILIETFLRNTPSRKTLINGKHAKQLELGRLARIIWLSPMMDRLWVEGADGRRRFLDRMAMSFIPRHAEAVLVYERAMRERNRLLRDRSSNTGWYEALESQMADCGAAIHVNRLDTISRLETAFECAESPFPTASLKVANPDDTDCAFLDSASLGKALSESRKRDMAAGRTLVGPHRSDLTCMYGTRGTDARSCSTGEQKALLISLILANARALARDLEAAPIVLLDEVAAHLDAERRATLIEEIGALGSQVWMTGTDAGLFDGAGRETLHLKVAETSGLSRIED